VPLAPRCPPIQTWAATDAGAGMSKAGQTHTDGQDQRMLNWWQGWRAVGRCGVAAEIWLWL
jgi:hypothetical protein